MYLHIGQDCVVADGEILGIFDLDTTSISKHTRDFLAQAEKEARGKRYRRFAQKLFGYRKSGPRKGVYQPDSARHPKEEKQQFT